MPEDPEDISIRARLLRGDELTWSRVHAESVPRARAAIRRKFGPDRRYLGAEDVVDSALGTILRRLKLARLVDGLNSWDDLQGLLVVVASRKLIDMLRKARAEEAREGRHQDDKDRDAADLPVLEQFYKEEGERAMDERLKQLHDALRDDTERIVFRGKLDRLKEEEIAQRVEAETGGRMTVYMVRETWRVIRA